MAGGMSMTAMVIFTTISVMLFQGVMAKNLTVGDDSGWSVPSTPDFYSSWAAKQSFAVGDVLVFNFPKGAHTVAQVTSENAYEKCDASLDPNAKIYETTAEVTLAKEGTYYFFCSVGKHCAHGQKLTITVPSTATATATAAAAAPPSPSKNSAFSTSAFPFSFMAIVMSLVVLSRVIN